jgi:methyl-accepting chemotaxis protein
LRQQPVRIADLDGRIIYANKALLAAVGEMEDSLRAYIPGFRADQLVGSDVGVFYREGREEAIAKLKNLTEMRRAEMGIGNRVYVVTTNPIINERGQRLGTVGEWRDRTSEVAVEQEVAAIVGEAANGNFSAVLPKRAGGLLPQFGRGSQPLAEHQPAGPGGRCQGAFGHGRRRFVANHQCQLRGHLRPIEG